MSIANRFPTSCPDSDTFIPQNLEPLYGVEVKLTALVSSPPLATDTENIFSTEGLVVFTKSTAGAWLLPAPIAGLPSAGGMDGKKLKLIDGSGAAHTATTPANGINGANHVLTFGGTKGEQIELTAYNGTWLAYGSAGVVIS
jgi:hypothetical protein